MGNAENMEINFFRTKQTNFILNYHVKKSFAHFDGVQNTLNLKNRAKKNRLAVKIVQC
jgi:hypothetical protein